MVCLPGLDGVRERVGVDRKLTPAASNRVVGGGFATFPQPVSTSKNNRRSVEK